jgi:hypothetical protein
MVVFCRKLIMGTYSRIGLLRSYGNLESYWTTTEPLELTVVLNYHEAMGTYSRIGLLEQHVIFFQSRKVIFKEFIKFVTLKVVVFSSLYYFFLKKDQMVVHVNS